MTDQIAIARGDGIGPEIMNATLQILKESGAKLHFEEIEVGEKVYLKGHKTGIAPEAWEVLQNSKAFLKAPITTPQGGGFRSLNVTIRTALGLYANVRPAKSLAPFVRTKHPDMDLVIVRENEEDLYTGIEYRPTENTYTATKIITKNATEKIVRYAFEYARTNNRKKVSCFTKDNILKISDGAFHKIFDEIAAEYPQIESEHWIVDIGSAKLADTPEKFDVIVLANLYGDILSDVAAQIAGSVGLSGSSNIGDHGAMFEAIHGSAPRRAGQNIANPSGLILASVMMLVHLGQFEKAEYIHNAFLKTIEEGICTYDIFDEKKSRQLVGTKEFADAICERLGKMPDTLQKISYKKTEPHKVANVIKSTKKEKKAVGVDIYIDEEKKPAEIAEIIKKLDIDFTLEMISFRGISVWPNLVNTTSLGENLRLRFMANGSFSTENLCQLLTKLTMSQIEATGVQILYLYDNQNGYSLSPNKQ